MKKLIIYSDGGSRGNPGPAGLGVVIENEKGSIIWKGYRFIGVKTNNQAEYQALLFGLEKVKSLKATEVVCNLDSELIVNQLNRKYKIKNEDLGPYFIKIWNISQSFKKVVYQYIPREKNRLADKLVNQAIDVSN